MQDLAIFVSCKILAKVLLMQDVLQEIHAYCKILQVPAKDQILACVQ